MQNSPPDLREELHLPGPGHGAGVGRVAVDVPGEAGGRDGGRGEARGRHGVPHRVPGTEVFLELATDLREEPTPSRGTVKLFTDILLNDRYIAPMLSSYREETPRMVGPDLGRSVTK